MAVDAGQSDQDWGYQDGFQSLGSHFDRTDTTASSETSEDREFVVSDTESLTYCSEASSPSHHPCENNEPSDVGEVEWPSGLC